MDFSQYKAFECDGVNIRNVTDVFRLFPEIPLRVFAKRGIGRAGPSGTLLVEARGWYPLIALLESFHDIALTVGPNKMYEVGRQIPKNAPFPPTVVDIRSALASIDVAYHMNHRKNGQVMFDLDTGRMLEGIGHYRATALQGKLSILVRCEDVPYPCELDRGIVSTLATRFEPNATVVHAPDSGCRRNGSNSCTYIVSW